MSTYEDLVENTGDINEIKDVIAALFDFENMDPNVAYKLRLLSEAMVQNAHNCAKVFQDQMVDAKKNWQISKDLSNSTNDMKLKAALRTAREGYSAETLDLEIGVDDCEEERKFFDVIRVLATSVEALPVPPAPTTWACTSCTFENPLDASTCEICDGPRISAVPLAASATPSDMIACSACTYEQNIDNRACELCGTHLHFI